jgi:hypothetical protein
MPAANDIHHIVGLLYAATDQPARVVTLGERVLDIASGTKRDVDVVIITAGSVEMIAAEVKHERRPLDVALIEGLCLKFSDMPSITDRNIVSYSGFSKPAIAKARHHNVCCLTLRRGPLRRLGSVDLSRIHEFGFHAPIWEQGPNIRLLTDPAIPLDLKGRLRPSLHVRYPHGGPPSVPLAIFRDRLVSLSVDCLDIPDDGSLVPVAVRLNITDSPFFTLGRQRYRVCQTELTGLLARRHQTVPLAACLTLEDQAGRPFAGVAIAELVDLPLALSTTAAGNTLNILLLPPGLRQVRPAGMRLSVHRTRGEAL